MDSTDPAELARKAHRTLEPLHTICYFAPEMSDAYAAAGAKGTMRAYFAVRSAPMGTVTAEVVAATFFNFSPARVAQAIPEVWQTTTPEAILAARYSGVDAAYRRILGNEVVESTEMVEAAALARELATVLRSEGRPLFAGHATLPWPDPPHLQLFHAQTLLREHRGDGHVAALTLAGLDGVGALVTHLAAGSREGMSEQQVRATRGWTDEEWDAGLERVREAGLIDGEGGLTDAGTRLRTAVEWQTDQAAAAPYRHLGAERVERLRTLGRPWSKEIAGAIWGGSR